MPKYPMFKYEFDVNGEVFLLAIGESKLSNEGVNVKVHKYSPGERMNRLYVSFDGAPWACFENGYRKNSPDAKLRQDFRRYMVTYPAVNPNGFKSKEIY